MYTENKIVGEGDLRFAGCYHVNRDSIQRCLQGRFIFPRVPKSKVTRIAFQENISINKSQINTRFDKKLHL